MDSHTKKNKKSIENNLLDLLLKIPNNIILEPGHLLQLNQLRIGKLNPINHIQHLLSILFFLPHINKTVLPINKGSLPILLFGLLLVGTGGDFALLLGTLEF